MKLRVLLALALVASCAVPALGAPYAGPKCATEVPDSVDSCTVADYKKLVKEKGVGLTAKCKKCVDEKVKTDQMMECFPIGACRHAACG